MTTNNALVLGLYVDSGFDATVTPDAAYVQRGQQHPALSSLVVEDRILSAGATPNATVRTGANTVWLMATLALKAGAGARNCSGRTDRHQRRRRQSIGRRHMDSAQRWWQPDHWLHGHAVHRRNRADPDAR